VPLHFHNCEESVLVLSGSARVHIDGVETDVKPRMTTWIPTGVPHFFRNTSSTEPMSMFWTYASIDANRTIVATGVTTRIDAEHR
jgi:putative monooxygenase